MSTAKPGRPNRGQRRSINVRAPLAHALVYDVKAEELGIPVSSYAAMVLAELHNLPIPDYIQDELREASNKRYQQELPLAG